MKISSGRGRAGSVYRGTGPTPKHLPKAFTSYKHEAKLPRKSSKVTLQEDRLNARVGSTFDHLRPSSTIF